MSVFDSFLSSSDIEWMDARGIPFCVLCGLHMLERPGVKRVFPITGDLGLARAYFGFYHLSHGPSIL